ncbi:hypothetical protein [Paenibacillus marinisediminis]
MGSAGVLQNSYSVSPELTANVPKASRGFLFDKTKTANIEIRHVKRQLMKGTNILFRDAKHDAMDEIVFIDFTIMG